MAYRITAVQNAPLNTAASGEAAAMKETRIRGVYCFSDYSDALHHEAVYVTDAPSKQAWEERF